MAFETKKAKLFKKYRGNWCSFLHGVHVSLNTKECSWKSLKLLQTSEHHESKDLKLKVSKFQNEFMKSSFLPKYEPKISGSYFGRNDDIINSFWNLLTFNYDTEELLRSQDQDRLCIVVTNFIKISMPGYEVMVCIHDRLYVFKSWWRMHTKVLFTDGFKGKNFVYEFCVLCILVNRLYTVIHNTQNS